ncbi:hypothetical protein NKR19_g7951 [Coniochaeta hoffmannii]|uniref:Ubiquitin-like domain-containing protein n=1 Tax=Coniochaeta hoffmannii TaxID=91930 RepID=A0AA38VFD8_9PEZI|nr:hypothetical protein NKR19_g7951 [Coniochaeta hoffmannii]
MSFGFSAGDIWEGGKVIVRSGRVVIDADKAPGEYQREVDTSAALESALDHLGGTLTSTRPHLQTSNINNLVKTIKTAEHEHKQKLGRRYGDKLGRNAPRGRRHGVFKKVQYTLFAAKDEEKHQKDQQGPLNSLQAHALGVVIANQDVQLSTVERGIAEEEAHHNSIVQKVSHVESTLLQKWDETESTRQQQQAYMASSLHDGIGLILGRLQDQKAELADELRRIMSEDGLRIGIYGSGRTSDDVPRKDGTPPTQNGPTPSTNCKGKDSTRPRCQDQVPCSARSIYEARKLEAMSVLRVHNRSMEFTWWNQGKTSRTIIPNVSLVDGDEGVLLTFLFILLGMCLELGLELGRFVSSQVARHAGISSGVSLFMSDTIEFTDALGRAFKLSVVQSTEWELFDAWLREQFKGCPGSAKVQNGKYVIFDARDPDSVLTKASWRQAVRPRRRFQMAIAYEHVQLRRSCPRPISQVSEPATFTPEYSHWRAGPNGSETEYERLDDDSEDAIGLPTCGPVRETSDQERRELEDLAHFSMIWMQRDDRLHNAALSGDYDATAALIRGGLDVNQTTGRTGSALIAAIASGSTRVVELLLTSGADPLQSVHQGHTPVSVAACFAGEYVADLILEAAFHASRQQPGRFQDAVDTALNEATRLERCDRHKLLLFMGANPTSTMRSGKSAFALALARNDSMNLEMFLTMLYDRSLLTDIEARKIFSAIRGMDMGSQQLQPWLRVCCAAISAGSSEQLETEVAKRVRKRGGLYFRLNIDNLRCHPDIRTFWRSYENQRLGIVRDPLLAGMA